MSDINMTDNWRNIVNTTPTSSLYQNFYSINCIKTKNSHPYTSSRKDTLTNRDVYNCTDECIHSKQLSEKYDIIRRTNNKTKNLFCYECGEYTESIEPIIIRQYQVHSFSLIVICQKCKGLKSCFITDFRHEKFSRHYFDLKLSRYYMNEFIDKNGIKHNIKNEINILIND